MQRIIQTCLPDVSVNPVLCREECLVTTGTTKPDLLMIGADVDTETELELLDEVHKRYPGVTTILFTDSNNDEYRREAVLRGAACIITKESWAGNEILALIKTLLSEKGRKDHAQVLDRHGEEKFFRLPLERRRKDGRGLKKEKEYLMHNRNRRI